MGAGQSGEYDKTVAAVTRWREEQIVGVKWIRERHSLRAVSILGTKL